MLILAHKDKSGQFTGYVGDVARTTIQGRMVLVGCNYEGQTWGEVCAQAYLNAKVRHLRSNLRDKLAVRRSS